MAETRSRRRAFYDWTRFAELAGYAPTTGRLAKKLAASWPRLGPSPQHQTGLPRMRSRWSASPRNDARLPTWFARARELSPPPAACSRRLPYVVAFAFSHRWAPAFHCMSTGIHTW